MLTFREAHHFKRQKDTDRGPHLVQSSWSNCEKGCALVIKPVDGKIDWMLDLRVKDKETFEEFALFTTYKDTREGVEQEFFKCHICNNEMPGSERPQIAGHLKNTKHVTRQMKYTLLQVKQSH